MCPVNMTPSWSNSAVHSPILSEVCTLLCGVVGLDVVGELVGAVVTGAADGAAVGDVGLDDGAAETGAEVTGAAVTGAPVAGAEVTGAAVGAPVAANLRRCAPIEPFVTTTETARVANRRRRRPYSATSAWIRIVTAPVPSYCATHEEIPIAGMN